MKNSSFTRREFLSGTTALALSTAALQAQSSNAQLLDLPQARKIVCVGGHPDDPESGCAGTLTRFSQQSAEVTVIYLTRGERGITGKNLEDSAAIRTAECQAACKIMGAKPVFAGQIDGATEVNSDRYQRLFELISAEKPDLILTHWPIDTHRDHAAASLLTFQTWLRLPRGAELFYFEVDTGSQSLGFYPNSYVDVTPVLDQKREALFVHRSQKGDAIWKQHHQVIAEFRGREAGVKAAEAFVRLARLP